MKRLRAAADYIEIFGVSASASDTNEQTTMTDDNAIANANANANAATTGAAAAAAAISTVAVASIAANAAAATTASATTGAAATTTGAGAAVTAITTANQIAIASDVTMNELITLLKDMTVSANTPQYMYSSIPCGQRLPVISLKRSWALAIIHCKKRIENRSWAFPSKEATGGGWFLIHVTKRDISTNKDDYWRELPDDLKTLVLNARLRSPALQTQRIVAIAHVSSCVRELPTDLSAEDLHWAYRPSKYFWFIDSVYELPTDCIMEGAQKFRYLNSHSAEVMVDVDRALRFASVLNVNNKSL